MKEGKVYVPEEATRSLGAFFSKSNLSALRELALRRAAQAVDAQMLEHVRAHALGGTWAGSERLVVAVSELPGADGPVRAAKRLADALHAPWTAVHTETPRSRTFGPDEHRRLADTLALATQLGGQVASVPATSAVEGLKRFTADARATQLIVGKSARSRWFELRHGSIVDQLIRETPSVAVNVLPQDGAAGGLARLRARRLDGGRGDGGRPRAAQPARPRQRGDPLPSARDGGGQPVRPAPRPVRGRAVELGVQLRLHPPPKP